MTVKQVYRAVLVEMNKEGASSLLLEDFNYLINKTILLYINERYNIYDVNQQTSDDLRVLKATAILPMYKTNAYGTAMDSSVAVNNLYGATYETYLPTDYLHMLNCICNFEVKKTYDCYDAGTYEAFSAKKLTSDAWSLVINNYYMRPSYRRPYYFVHNVNSNNSGGISTNPYNPNDMQSTGFGTGTDAYAETVNEAFENFKKKYPNLEFALKLGIVSAWFENTTLRTERTSYYHAYNLDGTEDYAVVYNTAKKEFELVEDYETTVTFDNSKFPNNNPVTIVTEGTNVKMINNTLYVNDRNLHTTHILVTPDFLNKRGSDFGIKGLPKTLQTEMFGELSLVEREAMVRYGNPSNVRLEVRYGRDDSVFQLKNVYIDYIKSPQHIRMTREQLDNVEDSSQMMEFPDYVVLEIIIKLVHNVMELEGNPRLQTHIPLNMSIGNPQAAQLEQTKK